MQSVISRISSRLDKHLNEIDAEIKEIKAKIEKMRSENSSQQESAEKTE